MLLLTASQVEPVAQSGGAPAALVLAIGLPMFLAIGGGVFVIVCFVTAMRGWAGYGVRHKGPDEPPAGISMQSGLSMMLGKDIAPANYRHVIRGGFNDEGIYLRTASVLRLFHPPIFVPWDAIETVEQKKMVVKGFYTAAYVEGLARLVFFGAFGDAILAHWEARGGASQGALGRGE